MFLDDNAAVHVGEAEVAESAAFVHHGMIGHPTKLVRSDVKKRYFWVVHTTKSGPPPPTPQAVVVKLCWGNFFLSFPWYGKIYEYIGKYFFFQLSL